MASGMKWAIVGLLLLGVLAAACVALLAASLPHLLGGGRAGQEPDQPEEISIVVASEDLAAPTVVRARSVALKTLERAQAPLEYFSSLDQVIGRALATPMVEGQPFSPTVFATEGSSVQLASTLPDDKRAFELSLPDYAGLSGLLYPGALVDIVATFDPTTRDDEPSASTLLQGVLVLKVDGRTIFSEPPAAEEPRAAEGGPTRRMLVVVQVTPEQAQTLSLAMEHGTVSLAMRKPTDVTVAQMAPTRLSELVAGLLQPEPEPTRAQTTTPAPALPVPALPQLPPAAATNAQPPLDLQYPQRPEPKEPWQTTVIRGPAAEIVVFPDERAQPKKR